MPDKAKRPSGWGLETESDTGWTSDVARWAGEAPARPNGDTLLQERDEDALTAFGGLVDGFAFQLDKSELGRSVNDLLGIPYEADPNPYGPTEGQPSPAWVADAQSYNRSRVASRFTDLALRLLRAGGDNDAYTWALEEHRREGKIGYAFSHLVASTQEIVNQRLPRGADEAPLDVDGCVGPETEARITRLLTVNDAKMADAQEDKDVRQAAARTEKAVDDVDSMGDVAGAGGDLLEQLLPNPGDEKSLEVGINCPVLGGVAKFGMFAKISGKHTDKDKFEVRLDAGFKLSGKLETWVATAWAKAKLYGYVEVTADSGDEVFDLVMLAAYEEVSDVSDDLASMLWGGAWAASVIDGMDKDDAVEYGLGVDVEAGVSFGSGGGDDDDGFEASAGAGATWGTKLTRGEDEGYFNTLDRASVYTQTASASVKVPGWGESTLTYTNKDEDGDASGSVAFTSKREIHPADFAKLLVNGLAIEQVLSGCKEVSASVARLIQGDAKAGAAGRRVSAALEDAQSRLAAPSADLAVGALVDKLTPLSQELSQVLKVTASWDKSGLTFDVEICGLNELTIGEDDDPMYLKYESLTRMLKFPSVKVSLA